MKTTTYRQPLPEALTSAERIARTTIGVALISSAFVAKNPIDWAIVMPLLGIYPLLTGLMGIEPMRVFLERGSLAYRAVQYTVGGALVGSLFVLNHFSSVPIAEFMVLPLVGIYYMLAGIMGQAPIAAVTEAMQWEAKTPTAIKAY